MLKIGTGAQVAAAPRALNLLRFTVLYYSNAQDIAISLRIAFQRPSSDRRCKAICPDEQATFRYRLWRLQRLQIGLSI
jgi:hypothetical protein